MRAAETVVQPPWTAVLSDTEHDLIFYGLVVTALGLLATLVRVRFASGESHGRYRTASLTANAVVALAFVSYLGLIVAFLLGYRSRGDAWLPTGFVKAAWSLRYMDWTITVPLLMIELVAISAVADARARLLRVVGMALGFGMISSGFLGAVIIDGGRDFTAFAVLGGIGAAFFAALYALILFGLGRSEGRMPAEARTPFRRAIGLLLVIWCVYPIVYGLQGVSSGGAWAAVGQLALCGADLIAKVGFGGLVHRTAVLRSRADENTDPAVARPRSPRADTLWVEDEQPLEAFDSPPSTSFASEVARGVGQRTTEERVTASRGRERL